MLGFGIAGCLLARRDAGVRVDDRRGLGIRPILK
jgi:hypothetical protein